MTTAFRCSRTSRLCSNGKVFASDERGLILYDIDTPTRKVVRYRLDVAARTATPDGVALDLADQVGFPDGMCDCGDGTVIVAFYNPDFAEAGRAVRFNLATGEAVEEWTTPGSPRVTCPLLVKRPGRREAHPHDRDRGHAGRDAREVPERRVPVHRRHAVRDVAPRRKSCGCNC